MYVCVRVCVCVCMCVYIPTQNLQMYCLKWAYLLKKLLLGYNPIDQLHEAARKVFGYYLHIYTN